MVLNGTMIVIVDIDNLVINISLDRYLSTGIGSRVW